MKTVVTVKLPSNSTYPYRVATFVKMCQLPIMGVLEIRESKSETNPPALISKYAVKEDSLIDTTDRVFRLIKPNGEGHYFCCLAADSGAFHQCECKGYERFGTCKHLQSLAELRVAGHLER